MDSSEKNFSQPGCVNRKNSVKMKGAVRVRHAKVALLIERGESVSVVAKETGLTKGRIYHLLGDEDSFVNTEIQRIRKEKSEAQDLLLAEIRDRELRLHCKALQHLESMIESPDKDERNKAIDQVMKTIARMTKTPSQPQRIQGLRIKFVPSPNNNDLREAEETGITT